MIAPVPPPAEWARHAAMWTAWPSHPDLWADDITPARAAIAQMIRALAEGEPVHVLVDGPAAEATAAAALAGVNAILEPMKFGDIWLRDTGPILLGDGTAATFDWNGWGGKYLFEADRAVAAAIAARIGAPAARHPWVLEGGAVEGDGTGAFVTTEECLLNPNRNPALDRDAIEARLAADLGASRVVWLGDGLAGDHTDGHIDNLARFVAPGRLAIPVAAGADDPNAWVYADARARALEAGLAVVPLPSPGRVEVEGELVAASYMNFIIGNAAVVVPTYGRPNDDEAVAAIAALFPGRRAVGVRADAVLTGGGSFHCITQQIPAP